MDFVKFESSREKERIRQQLREARDQMLDQAKLRREQRLKREAAQELRGESNWMLPTVAAKIDKLGKKVTESKRSKKKKEKAKAKKSKKKGKHGKKSKRYSSSESDPDTSEVDSDDSSSDGEPSSSSKKKKRKKKKKEYSSSGSDSWDMPSDDSSSDGEKKKSSKASSKKKKNGESSSTSSSDSDSSTTDSSSSSEEDENKRLKKELKRKHSESENGLADEKNRKVANKTRNHDDSDSDDLEKWVEKPSQTTTSTVLLSRDSWMTDPLLLKTFSKERKDNSTEKQNYEAYDPAKSTRELNPYWKTTGTGLPGFKKPNVDNDDDSDDERLAKTFASTSNRASGSGTSRSWQKRIELSDNKGSANMSIYSSESSGGEEEEIKKPISTTKFLTDQQMNELGAKLLKAEIMGNHELAAELKLQLEQARKERAAFKEQKLAQSAADNIKLRNHNEDDHVLLTRTDERGNTRPLSQASRTVDERELYGGRNARKKQKRLETHKDGERMRYFPDDDKYDIKQMFEREKYTSASDANLEFAKIAGKHKNPNDDLDDIFADEVRKDVSQSSTDRREMQRAITEHERLSAQLDNCRYCLDSPKMDKSQMVSMGEQVYLALPWYIGMQSGHCVISTTQHISCCTQLDEDTWSEVNDFRKAITRMFTAQKKDVVFFEIATRLSRRPHLSIHCVPIPDEQAEMAPFYFKKAVEESELEWSVNKQLVSLGRDGKGLRNCIPKGLPYFWVNFGMGSGFAHVIEDEDRFPQNFALEIIGGMLELDANKWRKPQKEQNNIAKVKMFADWWKKYDCTK